MKLKNTSLKNYLSALYNHDPGLIRYSAILMLLGALLEGIGLMLLVPLLATLGVTASSTSESPYTAWLSKSPIELNLTTILIIFLALVIFQAFIIRAREITLTKLRLRFVDHLRLKLFQSLTQASWGYFIQRKSAEFTHTIASDLVRIGAGTHNFLQLGVMVILSTVYVLVALKMSWPMTLLALVCGFFLWLLLRKQNRKALLSGKALTRANESLHHGLTEYLNTFKIAKSHSAESRHLQSFSWTLSDLQEQQLKFVKSRSTTSASYRIGAAFSLCFLLYVAIQHFTMGADRLLVLTLIFARLMPMLANLQQQFQHILHMLPAFTSYQDLLSNTQASREVDNLEKKIIDPFHTAIHFDNVVFAYADENPVLKGITCTLPAHQTIALVGPSGSGKTTFVDLLIGLLTPQAGAILIDETRLTPEVHDAWHAQLAYVPQDNVLFNDTLRNNLLWLQPAATDEAIWQALENASAGFVRKLPQGLDTIVGERGIRLSGGERQRIALARALLRKPRLLILDEATSALDQQHEQAIQQSLQRLHGDLTIVLIAHRLSSVRNADRILVIEHGSLVQQGTWEELMQEKTGLFYALHVSDRHMHTPEII